MRLIVLLLVALAAAPALAAERPVWALHWAFEGDRPPTSEVVLRKKFADLDVFLAGASFGRQTLGAVTILGPYILPAPPPGTCGLVGLAPALGMITSLPPSGALKFFMWTGGGPCGWKGLAPASSTIYTYTTTGLGVWAHEAGHALGFWQHAGKIRCGPVPFGPSCPVLTEYGDQFDAMGGTNGRPFTAYTRERLGWLSPRVVTASGEYVLVDSTTSPSALKIENVPVPAYGKRPASAASLYIEFRPQHGVMIAVGRYRIDATPATASLTGMQDAGFKVGGRVTTPGGHVVEVLETTATTARVRIVIP